MMNEFENICYKLEKCANGCRKSEIVCARKILEIHVNRDYDTFLKIKAESRKSNINEFRNIMISLCALVISVVTMLITTISILIPLNNKANTNINNLDMLITITMAVYIFLVMAFVIIGLQKIKKFNFVSKQGDYVRVILDEIESNKNYFK